MMWKHLTSYILLNSKIYNILIQKRNTEGSLLSKIFKFYI